MRTTGATSRRSLLTMDTCHRVSTLGSRWSYLWASCKQCTAHLESIIFAGVLNQTHCLLDHITFQIFFSSIATTCCPPFNVYFVKISEFSGFLSSKTVLSANRTQAGSKYDIHENFISSLIFGAWKAGSSCKWGSLRQALLRSELLKWWEFQDPDREVDLLSFFCGWPFLDLVFSTRCPHTVIWRPP